MIISLSGHHQHSSLALLVIFCWNWVGYDFKSHFSVCEISVHFLFVCIMDGIHIDSRLEFADCQVRKK